MRVLDLFSGIGGFSLGLERAGMRTIAFCELDAGCRAVLRSHWPRVPIYEDIKDFAPDRLAERPELICGGFPCQPHSTASRGRRVAEDLWPEFLRIIRGLRPCWVVAENVPGIGHDGVDRVCSDLENAGYFVWPFDLDTALPQRQRGRARFIWVAHTDRDSEPRRPEHAEVACIRPIPRRRASDHCAPVGVDDGLPGRMAGLHALGNAITPTIAELVGRAIMRVEYV